MYAARLAVPLLALAGLSGCFLMDSQCGDDTGGNDHLGITFLHDFSQAGLYELELSWEDNDVVCTWAAPQDQEDAAESEDPADPSCSGDSSAEVWGDLVGSAEVELSDVHPESLELRVTRDGEELHRETLTPDYLIRGGDRCGREYHAQEEVQF